MGAYVDVKDFSDKQSAISSLGYTATVDTSRERQPSSDAAVQTDPKPSTEVRVADGKLSVT